MRAERNNYWLICGLLGLVILGLSLAVLGAFPEDGHSIDPGYGGPVFAFEMAKSQADLIAVFGSESDPERARRISQMDIGNLWDFPYMLIYSLYMASFAFAAFKANGTKLWLVIVAIALLSGLADAIENIILLGLTKDIAGAPNIGLLGFPVWTKFLSIMVCICAAGVYIFRQSSWISKALGIIAIIGGLTVFAAFIAPNQNGWLIRHGVGAGWFIMLVFAWVRWKNSERPHPEAAR